MLKNKITEPTEQITPKGVDSYTAISYTNYIMTSNNKYSIDEHTTVMNETDRTIVGLLWHENIVDVLNKLKIDVSIPVYLKLLENICFADYIDRITFQKQIWQFNEMSSIIKTLKNNKLLHETFF